MELKSEGMSKAATLSYSGSAARIWRITRTGSTVVRWLLAIPAALILVALAWVAVTAWYGVWALGGVILFLPLRLLGRGRRKRKLEQQRHREQMGALTADQ